jgi:choice-of-anchor A domain-containing protein
MKGIIKLYLFVLFILLSVVSKAHTVNYYTSCGYICSGSVITIDANITNAGSGTYYNWQYRDNSGVWTCFVTGSNTINGKTFTVSGTSAVGPANDAPLLTIQNASIELEDIEVRVLMADNGTPCGSPSYSVWGGDTDPNNYYRSLRLHVLSGVDCSLLSTYCGMGGCAGNTLSDAGGYFGGFEASNNWSGAATNYTNGGASSGQYSVLNNVRNVQSAYPAFAPKSGNYMMYVNGSTSNTARIWYKTGVSLTANTIYQFSAWVANANNTSTNLSSIVLKVNGVSVDTGTVTATAGDWVFIQGDYTATSTGTVTLEIFNLVTQSSNNDFVLDDICFKSLGTAVTTCGTGYFNPFAPAVGLNVCVKNNVTFQTCHTDGPVGMGGDATLNGTSTICSANTGSYPFGKDIDENYGLIIGGKLNYTSGSQSTINNGICRIGNTTGSSLFYNDCNNATTNFKCTPYNSNCTTAYNNFPQIACQKPQADGSAIDDHDIDFTGVFTGLQDYSNKMALYTASSSCSSSLNIITLGSGSQSITLVSNKVNVVNLTSAQFTAITSLSFNNAPTATSPLIFNVNGTGSFTWASFNMAGLANTDGAYIIFNFYNNTGTITLTGASTVVGSIFAPGATFIKNHTGNTEGQIASASCTLNGGEVHHQLLNVCLPDCTSSGGGGSSACVGNLLTNTNGYYGGFEAGVNNISATGAATDLKYGLPANATYEIVKTPSTGGGGGYISMQPHSGSYLMIAHTPSNSSRIWYKTISVTPGYTYQFCAWIANGKANPSSGFTVNLFANGTSIASGTAGSTWSQLCGSYTVPAGVTSIEISVKDLTPTSGNYSHFLYLDDICFVLSASSYSLGNTVWYDVNNNGTKDAGEPGISGVTVKLYNCSGTYLNKTVTTDASGNYQFDGLAIGSYIVGITTPSGYTKSDVGTTSVTTDNQNDGVNIVSTEIRTNCFTTTGTTSNIDFGLKGLLNIGNLVWNDINGNGIKNTFESGIDGVTVYLYQDANNDNVPDGSAISATTTSGGGIYAFSNLAPGNYIVGIVTPVGYANSYKPANNANPNSDVDNDNNGVAEYAGIIRSNYVTLSVSGEPASGVDGDGTNGNLTVDFAVAKDTDGDKIPDVIDIDDDNDGITDVNESGGYDPLGDCDGDGIPNYLDPTPGCTTPSGNDPWGVPYKPLVWADCNGDGINDFFDWDRDGIINELDLDSDNDGILDVQEARPGGVAVTATANGYDNGNSNPKLNGIQAQDLDKDGTPNFLDLDSDGDGMTDLTEALGTYSSTGVVTGTDEDGDGVKAENFGSSAASTADNMNGFGAKGITLLDSDGDGKPNCYDIDSDNDGITDNTEAQATCSYKLPSGTDCDGDGVDDSYDALSLCVTCTRTSGGLTPYDKDGDGIPDYLDTDTDGDGALDIYEGHSIIVTGGHSVPPTNYWTGGATDTDGDGLIDYFDGFNLLTQTTNFWRNVITNNMGNNGSWDTGSGLTGSISQLPESDDKGGCAGGGERDWRTITILPVSLIEFKGNLNNATAKLMWSVTKEVNMNYYEVERSIDGISFNKIATITAVNNSNTSSITNYTANDDISSLNSGTIYYRLKIVEKDGSSKNSNIINFKLSNKPKLGIVVNPNPAVNFFTLKITAAKDAVTQIRVIDMLGKVLIVQNNNVLSGINSYTFNDLSKFNSGTYFVQVICDGQLYTEKLIVTK